MSAYNRFPWLKTTIAGRVPMNDDEIRALFFPALPPAAVRECLAFLRDDIMIPVEILRPDDDLAALLEPPPSGGLFHWLTWRRAFEDALATVLAELRRRQQGREPGSTTTFGEVVRVWCGGTAGPTSPCRSGDEASA